MKLEQTEDKYRLPNQWLRDPAERWGMIYLGYVQIVREIFDQLPAGRVLDAGCNDGRVAHELVEAGHSVYGVDVLETSVAYATHLVPEGTFETADLRSIEPSDFPHAFDYVNCIEVIEHLQPEHHASVLRNLNRVLTDDGVAVVSFPSTRASMSDLHYKHFELDEATDLLESSGFEVVDVVPNKALTPVSQVLFSNALWYLLWNPVWRLRGIGLLIHAVYMRYFNEASVDDAGRYIVVARKVADADDRTDDDSDDDDDAPA